MYSWRKLTDDQRKEVIAYRIKQGFPWHSPPTLFHEGYFHLTAACYEHRHYIGHALDRLGKFAEQLLHTFEQNRTAVFSWCVLPNHYHVLIETKDLKVLKKEIGKLHGRSSHEWNLEEQTVGRTVWHSCADRGIRSERHYWATFNYIHNNPVHHRYVTTWTEWPFSSASDFLTREGRERALFLWKEYPVLDYGKGWDDPEM
jgi:putative transposase